ncbi:adenine-specific DNA-methyltransferase [Geosporobacter subterraneus DSM 17957]|uniref:Adenine-specific DNA-methyltransferase n=1 Tax=Geosporobacter subterraneus DSM 17957 TaxID=1121919 RepID=A0A1M6FH96_9FIRM|nr:site-specific DNA-methyltransferase [Geosporobacter subterraneus]SHI97111.1 adenine-specific DNA-methyltransferase [Geosporobacter subterraneus DSM 17957]
MDKMRFESANLTAANIEKIAELFPGVVTEGKVNFDLLRSLLGDEVYGDEAYEFTWVGKRAAIAEAGRPIRKTLRPCPEESKNWDTTENLYIEGDNLDVLKLLQESYLGKVKMIYIDPPYNTGNDFIYRDNFTRNRDEYAGEAGVYDEDGDRLFRNTESNGRFHSDWCSMMYPRLVLARNLLRDDGVIFISIDDGEQGQLKKICDEVFGESNFAACIPWQSRLSMQNDTDLSINHEYLIVYAKKRRFENRRLKESNVNTWYNKDSFVFRPLPLDKDKFDNPDNDPRGLWKADPFDAPNVRPNLTYPITNPNTGEQHLPPSGRHWRISPEKFSSALANGRIIFGKNGTGRPQMKSFYEEKKDFGSIDNSWFSGDKVGTATAATKELQFLFENSPFDTPKPTTLLKKLITLGFVESGDIILDFFSGSATTAHAVMQLNAEDGGKRKFIMVQLPEPCPEGSEAAKAGYKNICEIGKERIRRAGEKIKEAAGLTAQNLDIGFRVLKLDDTNMKDVYYAASEYTQDLLSMMEDNIKDDRTDMDLLYACLLDWGLPLSMPHTQEKIGGFTVHTYNDGDLIACFDKHISDEVVKEIARRQPLRAVFRDSSFACSPEKINVEEIFKLLAPNTSVRVI